jgi:tetratricopeptide (TPR) repeat protein
MSNLLISGHVPVDAREMTTSCCSRLSLAGPGAHRLGIAFAVLVAIGLSGTPAGVAAGDRAGDNPSSLDDRFKEAIQRGDVSGALLVVQEALSQDGHDSNTVHTLLQVETILHCKLKQPESALASIQRARKRWPENADDAVWEYVLLQVNSKPLKELERSAGELAAALRHLSMEQPARARQVLDLFLLDHGGPEFLQTAYEMLLKVASRTPPAIRFYHERYTGRSPYFEKLKEGRTRVTEANRFFAAQQWANAYRLYAEAADCVEQAAAGYPRQAGVLYPVVMEACAVTGAHAGDFRKVQSACLMGLRGPGTEETLKDLKCLNILAEGLAGSPLDAQSNRQGTAASRSLPESPKGSLPPSAIGTAPSLLQSWAQNEMSNMMQQAILSTP